MKLIENFDKFLKDTVNLNKARYDTAIAGISTITSFLKSNELLKNYFINTSPQGSIKQKTIIKPASEEQDFDVDLLFEMEIEPSWEPKDYLENIADQFRKSDRYKDLVDTRGKTRCVTIDYESDFHLDIVPAVKTIDGYWIMNKKTNEYEPTDGDGYAQWFENQTVVTNGFLVESVRLMKYLRDIKEKYEAKSILITTLLGSQITTDDIMDYFPDLPTTFRVLIKRLDEYLQSNPEMPVVENPVMPEENFNRHWDQEKYESFSDEIHTLKIKIDDAYSETDERRSVYKWRQIFGNEFPELENTLKSNTPESYRDEGEKFLSDLGIPIRIQYQVRLNAIVEQNGFRPFMLLGNLNPLRKQRGLKFVIENCNVPQPFDIKWKVKNYGEEAARFGQLRGEITHDRGKYQKKESTKYMGKHYVECYVIKEGICVAQDRISVPIGSF